MCCMCSLMEFDLKLNGLIMDTAIRGKNDSEKWIDINWKVHDPFVFVYIEDLQTNSSSYRVFLYRDITQLQKQRLLYPDYKGEDLICLYDSTERADKREVLHCEDLSTWYEEALSKAKQLVSI